MQKPVIQNRSEYYRHNLKYVASRTNIERYKRRFQTILLRDTESYLVDIVQRLKDELGVDVGDFINSVNSINDPQWR